MVWWRTCWPLLFIALRTAGASVVNSCCLKFTWFTATAPPVLPLIRFCHIVSNFVHSVSSGYLILTVSRWSYQTVELPRAATHWFVGCYQQTAQGDVFRQLFLFDQQFQTQRCLFCYNIRLKIPYIEEGRTIRYLAFLLTIGHKWLSDCQYRF